MLPVLIISILILLNALFVAAEFGIVGAPRSSIDRLATRGVRRARLVRRILHDPRRQDRYIATAQLGITLASLGLGMYGEHVLAEWLYERLAGLGDARWLASHALASSLAVAILTYFHIVLGEMIPKSLALLHAEATVLRVTPVMLAIQKAMFPLVAALNGLGNGILRLVGINRQEGSGEHYHTADELRFIIRQSHEGGLLRQESARLLGDLFDFSDLTAGEVMVPRVRVRGIPTDADREELMTILRSSQHSRYPMFEGDLDHITGVIHVRDLLQTLIADQAVRQAPVRPVAYVPETTAVDMVLETMRQMDTEFVVVMDEHGGTAGIVTVEDLFEEIVGEIEEGVDVSRDIFRDREGRLHVAGTVRVEEVGEQLGQTLEHDEVDTVSGLILSFLDRPPRVGDRVVYDDVQFEVVAVEGHGVRECLVTPQPPPPDRRRESTPST